MFETKMPTRLLLSFGLTITTLIHSGCQSETLVAQPHVRTNQELTQLGSEVGLKSYGLSRNVSIFPIQNENTAIDFLIVAENSHGEPFYFGLEDIIVKDQNGAVLNTPSLAQVLENLDQSRQMEFNRILKHADQLGMRRGKQENRGYGPQTVYDSSNPKGGGRSPSEIDQERLQEYLRQSFIMVHRRYEKMKQKIKEEWLHGEVVLPSDYTQGLIRVELPEESIRELQFEISTGVEHHHATFDLSDEKQHELAAVSGAHSVH